MADKHCTPIIPFDGLYRLRSYANAVGGANRLHMIKTIVESWCETNCEQAWQTCSLQHEKSPLPSLFGIDLDFLSRDDLMLFMLTSEFKYFKTLD